MNNREKYDLVRIKAAQLGHKEEWRDTTPKNQICNDVIYLHTCVCGNWQQRYHSERGWADPDTEGYYDFLDHVLDSTITAFKERK